MPAATTRLLFIGTIILAFRKTGELWCRPPGYNEEEMTMKTAFWLAGAALMALADMLPPSAGTLDDTRAVA